MRQEHRTTLLALAAGVLALLLIVVLAAVVEGAPAAERPEGWSEHQIHAHAVAEQLRALGYEDDNPVIAACQEWWRAEKEDRPLSVAESGDSSPQGASQEYTTKAQKAEYPEASYVWQLLKEAGLSDIHAAAILGNAMAESGGQTLAINIYQDASGYWGAWAMSKVYYADVVGQGADAQVAKILATLGEDFYQTTDVRSAARWFSDYWERPAVWSEVRADNAERALRYFGGAGNG